MKYLNLKILIFFVIFLSLLIPANAFNETGDTASIASGVVPHHLLAKEIMEDFFNFIAQQESHPDTIILVSPDHFNCSALQKENSFISIDWETDNVKLDEISVNCKLLKELSISNKIKPNRNSVLAEFGITNLLPFIKEYLPRTKIIPIIIPEDISREQVSQMIATIDNIAPSKPLLVASVDFSHYLPQEAAAFHDKKSIRVLLNCEKKQFENIEVDSWQSLYAVRLFAKLRESEKPVIVAHKNSVDFLPYDLNSTTSYFSVIFQEGDPEENLQAETVLLAGDIMLGRGMEKLMKENSIYYPFQEIVQLLRGVDIVFANLEGPVVHRTQEFSAESLKFSFHPSILEGIKWSKINLLSLANNHTSDIGKVGLEETRDWLDKYQIQYIGNPMSGNQDMQSSSFSTQKTVFLAFNRILPFINSQEEIIKNIKKAKLNNPGKIIIVSIHWGNEYELTSSPLQRELAQQIIAAGADIIVGHHPHVVQEIDIIQDKPIFYSLGNFIFDQQVIPETKEGLAVALTISNDKLTFRLFPIKNQSGQPILMNQNEAEIFLSSLAQKSDKRLWEKIKKGIIELELVK
ncbi:MAG: AmmeMemoRadiSam system protein B [bacterium]